MTPVGSRGPLDYADYQRVENWDGPTILNQEVVNHLGKFTTGIFQVSRYGYLGGSLQIFTNPVIVTIRWFISPTAEETIGAREFMLDPLIKRGANLRIPNLGPWCEVLIEPATEATSWKLSGTLFGTNRYHPLEFIPTVPVILNDLGIFKPGVRTIARPKTYYAGPCRVLVISSAEPCEFELQEGGPLVGEYTQADVMIVAAKEHFRTSIVTPPGAWQCILTNTGGAESAFRAIVMQSMTGST